MLDDPPPHIGLALQRAALLWQETYRAELVRRGFAWRQNASGELMDHLTPQGISQAALTEKAGLSKQAVQQLLDQLEAAGAIARVADPRDRRAKLVMLTALGLRDYTEAAELRENLEAAWRDRLGKKRFARLGKSLKKLANPVA